MKKTSKIIMLTLVVAALLLGIGYAAIQNITLNISGTATADPSQTNFKVSFSGEPEVSDSRYVTAAITDEINATINVNGLTEKGQEVSATYTIQNTSTDLSADLSVLTTNSNQSYFTITSELGKVSLVSGEATTVTITVRLSETPMQVDTSESSTIGIQLDAIPVQPGEEGSSGLTNDFSQSPETLALVTNDNIGEYINVGNDIVGTESTTDDWRILYTDENNVYVILADYLPAGQVPEESGLATDEENYPYSVWSDEDRDVLINGLIDETAWSGFTNGIYEATATGSPTAELLINSYNAKNGTELVYTDTPTLDSTTEDYSLYVPHTSVVSGCYGYLLATPNTNNSDSVWNINYIGNVGNACNYDGYVRGIRPVISIPKDVEATYSDGVWEISNFVYLF